MRHMIIVALLMVCLLGVFGLGGASAAPTLTTSTLITRGAAAVELVSYTVNAADGNLVANTGTVRVLFQNESTTSALTVTIVTQQTVLGLAVADLTFSVPAEKIYVAGPFPAETFNYQTGTNAGRFLMTFAGDAVVHAKVAPFR